MQSTCPRSFLPPLQIGLSVTLEHKYGHRDLVDMINTLGFCSSYTEASKYRRNAATTQDVDLRIEEIADTFVQYQADNVDHASTTLDGCGSIHVMGQMGTFTPALKVTRRVPRLKVTMDDLKKVCQVKLVAQKDVKAVQGNIIYGKLGDIRPDDKDSKLDMLWRVSSQCKMRRPLWSGCMKMLHSNISHPGKSAEIFLPLINLTPSDPTCVRSTLEYLCDHALRHGITSVITFDQQLWWIAYMVIESQLSDSPLRQIKKNADYDIAMVACRIALTQPVVVVGDDTDLLILLQHHFSPINHEAIYLQTKTKLIDISILKKELDPDLSNSLLFIHALSGCDTTSKPSGIGKLAAMAKYRGLKKFAELFMVASKNQDEIELSGNEAIATLYGCKHGPDLNFERASKFNQKVASSFGYLPPERLPPTSDAAKFHGQRVYLQPQA